MKVKKKNFDYFESLVNMSLYALDEANLLKEIFGNYTLEKIEEQHDLIHTYEHKCDMVKHDLTTALVKEFLPPVDRDDLFRLAHVTDNLTDSVESVVAFIYMADIKNLRPDVMDFANLIIESCSATVELLKEFRNFKKSTKINELIIKLNDLEEEGDRLYAKANKKLSKEAESTREVLDWREIYRYLEKCFDSAESIADNIESVVMKNS